MSYKTILLILFLSLLAGLMWFIYHIQTTPSGQTTWTFVSREKPSPSYAESLEEKKSQADLDTTHYNTALKEKTPALCDMISDTPQKVRCHDMIKAGTALEKGDITICDTLSESGIISQCRDSVAYRRAENTREKIECDTITDENIRTNCIDMFAKEEVIRAIASGSLTEKNCDTLSTTDLRSQCLSRLQSDEDTSLYRQAIDSGDPESCTPIIDTTLKQKCRDTLLLDRALTSSNLELCASIGDTDRALYCQKTILARTDITRYQEIIRTGDRSKCGSLTVLQMQHQCHDTILFSDVRTSQDPSLCDTLYNTGILDRCRAMVRVK